MGEILKRQGKVKAGVADFCFQWGDGGGQIELKIGRVPQSQAQREMEATCITKNVRYRVARSVDEVVVILEEWGRLPAGTHKRIRGL